MLSRLNIRVRRILEGNATLFKNNNIQNGKMQSNHTQSFHSFAPIFYGLAYDVEVG